MGIIAYRTTTSGARFGAYGEPLSKDALISQEYGPTEKPFAISISFSTKASRFIVLIRPDSFGALAKAMMECDTTEAIRAFGAALQSYGEVGT